MPEQPAVERKNMDKKDILSRVDHTLLSQTATWEEIRQILDDGIKYGCAGLLCETGGRVCRWETADLYGDRISKRIPHNGDENFRDKGCGRKRSRRDRYGH